MIRRFIALGLFAFFATQGQAETLRLLTSDSLSPFSRGADQDLPGFNHEYAEAVVRQAGHEPDIQYFPWKRAQMMVKNEPNTLLVNLARTDSREGDFDWVTRVQTIEFVFVSTQGQINDIDTARGLKKVGAFSAPKAILEKQGLTNVEEAPPIANIKKLDKGRIDTYFTTSMRARFLWVHEMGKDAADLAIGDSIRTADMWIAGSKGLDHSIIVDLNRANAELRENGTFHRLYQKYFGDLHVLEPARPDLMPTGTVIN